jgi:hypothetical protein
MPRRQPFKARQTPPGVIPEHFRRQTRRVVKASESEECSACGRLTGAAVRGHAGLLQSGRRYRGMQKLIPCPRRPGRPSTTRPGGQRHDREHQRGNSRRRASAPGRQSLPRVTAPECHGRTGSAERCRVCTRGLSGGRIAGDAHVGQFCIGPAGRRYNRARYDADVHQGLEPAHVPVRISQRLRLASATSSPSSGLSVVMRAAGDAVHH